MSMASVAVMKVMLSCWSHGWEPTMWQHELPHTHARMHAQPHAHAHTHTHTHAHTRTQFCTAVCEGCGSPCLQGNCLPPLQRVQEQIHQYFVQWVLRNRSSYSNWFELAQIHLHPLGAHPPTSSCPTLSAHTDSQRTLPELTSWTWKSKVAYGRLHPLIIKNRLTNQHSVIQSVDLLETLRFSNVLMLCAQYCSLIWSETTFVTTCTYAHLFCV